MTWNDEFLSTPSRSSWRLALPSRGTGIMGRSGPGAEAAAVSATLLLFGHHGQSFVSWILVDGVDGVDRELTNSHCVDVVCVGGIGKTFLSDLEDVRRRKSDCGKDLETEPTCFRDCRPCPVDTQLIGGTWCHMVYTRICSEFNADEASLKGLTTDDGSIIFQHQGMDLLTCW